MEHQNMKAANLNFKNKRKSSHERLPPACTTIHKELIKRHTSILIMQLAVICKHWTNNY